MKIRPLVYIVPTAILLVALLIGSSLLFQVFLFLIFTGVIALLWVLLGTHGLRVEQGDIPVYSHAGSSFTSELIVKNESVFPKWLLKANIQNNIPGFSPPTILNLPGRGVQPWQNTLTCRTRGLFHVGPLTVTAGDPFGLFSRQKQIGNQQSIIVYPKIVDLPLFHTSLSSLVDFGRSAGGRRISQISPSASSVREMVSGDSQEHIHWRSTAHTGKLMVKVFDAEHSSEETKNAWIVLDMNEKTHVGQREESTDEYAVTIAASLVKKYLDEGMHTGLDISSDKGDSFSPNTGTSHFNKMLETMALVQAKGNIPMAEFLHDFGRFGNHSTVVVITPDSGDAVLQELRRMKNYGHTVVAIFLDRSTFDSGNAPEQAVHNLGSAGIQVYVVKKGDNLARALDSSVALWYSRYV